MQLNELGKTTKNRKRVGRGIGAGNGKTCGRGHKGQKSRTGVSINGFEGGQQPIYIRLPKYGFTNIFRTEYTAINLGDLQAFVDSGRLNSKDKISNEALYDAGILNRKNAKVKLLGQGVLKAKLNLELDAVSKTAKEAVEKAGGSVTLRGEKAA